MNKTAKCVNCGSTLSEKEAASDCPVCLLSIGLALEDQQELIEENETVGRYRLLSKIGRGGMGQVYKAKDSQLGRLVAIKFLPLQLATSEDSLQRFQREATALSQLNDRNICVVHDVGSSQRGPYIVMEYVEGKSLGKIMQSESLSVDRCLDIMLQICHGLQVVHEKGMVHRDIKPSNVMLTRQNVVKIVDFGLAKWTPATESGWTQHNEEQSTGLQHLQTTQGQVIGTPSYMSPEQASGMPVDSRSDIFSLGALLYRMLVGRPPFIGETPMLTMHSIVSQDYPPLRTIDPTLPASLESIVDRMLGDLEGRFQTIQEIAPLLAVEKSVPTPNAAVVPTDPGKENSIQRSSHTRVPAFAGSYLWGGLVIGALIILGLLILSYWNQPAVPGTDPQTAATNRQPDPKGKAGKQEKTPAPNKKEATKKGSPTKPIKHQLVLGVVIDPVPFVDQRNSQSKDNLPVEFHRSLQERLGKLMEEAEFPVKKVTFQEWETTRKGVTTENDELLYSLSVARLLREKKANLFLSITGHRDPQADRYCFLIQAFNLEGIAFHQSEVKFSTQQVVQPDPSFIQAQLKKWVRGTFWPKQPVSRGIVLSGKLGLYPAATGIVILPAFEEYERPWQAFEFINPEKRIDLQHLLADKIRDRVKVTTPTIEEWRKTRRTDGLYIPFFEKAGANCKLTVQGEYSPDLLTYSVDIMLYHDSSCESDGQHHFAYTRDFFREQFDKVVQDLLSVPILQDPTK